jgi:ferredoxin-thioredoxin reductase catalytic subunit
MPRHVTDREPWDDDEELTIPCPYCKQQIHEDSDRCPYCEQYLSQEDAPAPRRAWWVIVGSLLCLYAVYRWIAG